MERAENLIESGYEEQGLWGAHEGFLEQRLAVAPAYVGGREWVMQTDAAFAGMRVEAAAPRVHPAIGSAVS